MHEATTDWAQRPGFASAGDLMRHHRGGDVPEDVEVPVSCDRATLVTAGVAWEVAACWVSEPEYASSRLAELASRTGRSGC